MDLIYLIIIIIVFGVLSVEKTVLFNITKWTKINYEIFLFKQMILYMRGLLVMRKDGKFECK